MDAFTAGSGNDTFSATIGTDSTGTGTTLTVSDNLNGGTGADKLAVSISGANTAAATTTGFAMTGIETLELTNFETSTSDNTLNMAQVTGLTTVSVTASSATGDTALTNLGNIVSASMANGSGDLNLGYTAATVIGTADSQSLTLSGQTGGTFTANGIETLSITSSGSANTVLANTAGVTTINVSGSQNLTLTEGMANTITRVNASTMTGNLTFTTDDVTAMSVTGGSGNDSFVFGTNFSAADSVDGGAGTTDNLTVGSTIASAAALANVTNVERLTLASGAGATFSTNVGPTTFNLSTDTTANTLTLDALNYTNATTVNVGAGDTVTATASNAALTVNATADAMVTATVTAANPTTAITTDTLNLTTSSAAPAQINLLARANRIDIINVVDGGDNVTTGQTDSAGFDVNIVTGAVGHNVTVDASALDASLVTSPTDGTAETLTFDGSGSTSASRVFNVTGGAAQDTITGGGGNDILNGGAGNDSLVGGGGADSISGGLGDDTINMAANLTTADTINGGEGNDRLIVTDLVATSLTNVTNVETLVFGGGTATISLATPVSFTTIDMNNGTTDNTAQAVTLAAGFTGSPTFEVDAGDSITNTANATLTVNSSDDTMSTTTITGGTGTDTLNLTPSSTTAVAVNLFDPTTGAAIVTGVEVINVLDAGDLGTVGSQAATSGRDASITTGNYASATTVATTLTINASALDAAGAYVDATTGNTVDTGREDLTVNGSGITNALVRLSVTGGGGADTITGGAGNDILAGGVGTDTITANGGIDSISGGDGSDRIVMGANLTSADTVDGGTGTDTMTVDAIGSDDVLTNVTSVEAVILAGGATLGAQASRAGIATVTTNTTASAVNASAMTTGVTFQVRGAAGQNQNITGGSGDDTFSFGGTFVATGDGDVLDASDVIAGGTGNDTVTLSNALAGVTTTIDLDNITAVETVRLGSGAGLASTSTEAISLTIDALTLTTVQTVSITASTISDARDTVTVLMGTTNQRGTSFSITGGAGNDTLNGGSNNDTIVGGTGNDSITGGAGNDQLTGGSNSDIFVIEGSLGTARDTITDFTAGTDKLQVTFTSAATLIDATLKGTVTSSGDASSVMTGAVGQVVMNSGNGTLMVDLNGNGFIQGNDIQVTLQNAGAALTSFAAADIDFSITGDNTGAGQTITTGEGNDTISGLGGTDTLSGGGGNDSIVGGAAADTISGGSGADTITGDGTADNIDGGSGDDLFIIGAAADHAAGETIIGGTGSDTIRFTSAAAGTLTLTATVTDVDNVVNVQVASAAGLTTGTTAENVTAAALTGSLAVNLTGNDGANALTGTGNDDTIRGNGGNDVITGGVGNDSLDGGAGDDSFVVAGTTQQGANDTIAGGTGTNSISLNNAAAAVTATFDFDNISDVLSISAADDDGGNAGTAQAVTITFSAISETTGQTVVLSASAITDTNDTLLVTNSAASSTTTFSITGGAGADSLIGSLGADTLSGGGGADTITGGDGADSITGGAGADSLTGGTGDDVFIIGAAADHAANESITGGTGSDTIRFSSTTDGETLTLDVAVTDVDNLLNVVISTATGVTTGTQQLSVTAAALTGTLAVNLTGNDGANALTGTANADTITGGAGADTITGGVGSDSVDGGTGDDVFVVAGTTQQGADDTIVGGTGTNSISLNNAAAAVTATFDFDNISDVLSISAADDDGGNAATAQAVTITFSAISETTAQTVVLSASAITDDDDALLVTNSAASSTTTFSITGGAGNDSLVGSLGSDTLSGGSGVDTITGGDGADTITGGASADVLTGGSGADRFVAGTQAVSNSTDFDSIQDFLSGTDKLDLSGDLVATPLTAAADGNANLNARTQAFNTSLAQTFADAVAAAAANSFANVGDVLVVTITGGTTSQNGVYVIQNLANAGFAAGDDLVIKLVGSSSTVLGVGDFI